MKNTFFLTSLCLFLTSCSFSYIVTQTQSNSSGIMTVTMSAIMKLSSGSPAWVVQTVFNGTKTVGLASGYGTSFSGYLIR